MRVTYNFTIIELYKSNTEQKYHLKNAIFLIEDIQNS